MNSELARKLVTKVFVEELPSVLGFGCRYYSSPFEFAALSSRT